MERLKRNPGGWGLALGGAIGFVSIFFSWMSVTNTAANVTSSRPGVPGRLRSDLGVPALLVAPGRARRLGLPGERPDLVRRSSGCSAPRSCWWPASSRSSRPPRSPSCSPRPRPMSKLALTSVQNSINETVKAGFAYGTLTASVGFGAILGVTGGRSASWARSSGSARSSRPSTDRPVYPACPNKGIQSRFRCVRPGNQHPWRTDDAEIDVERRHQLRARDHPGLGVPGDRGEDAPVQPAPR